MVNTIYEEVCIEHREIVLWIDFKFLGIETSGL